MGVIRLEAEPRGRPMFLIEIAEEPGRLAALPEGAASLAKLTTCEREVARLVGTGCSNEEIARQLGKSIMTVKKQLQSIYQKLKVPNRGRLIASIH